MIKKLYKIFKVLTICAYILGILYGLYSSTRQPTYGEDVPGFELIIIPICGVIHGIASLVLAFVTSLVIRIKYKKPADFEDYFVKSFVLIGAMAIVMAILLTTITIVREHVL